MQVAEISKEESLRLSDLHSLDILDTPAEREFDELVELAAMICGCPISLMTFIDKDRQWIKAQKGGEFTETAREVSFCDHAIKQDNILVVENAIADKRFTDNPFVTGEVHIRFYAGAPVYSPQGHKMGTLCVIDRRPKTLFPKHIEALKKLSNQASKLLELRMKTKLLDKLMKEGIQK